MSHDEIRDKSCANTLIIEPIDGAIFIALVDPDGGIQRSWLTLEQAELVVERLRSAIQRIEANRREESQLELLGLDDWVADRREWDPDHETNTRAGA